MQEDEYSGKNCYKKQTTSTRETSSTAVHAAGGERLCDVSLFSKLEEEPRRREVRCMLVKPF